MYVKYIHKTYMGYLKLADLSEQIFVCMLVYEDMGNLSAEFRYIVQAMAIASFSRNAASLVSLAAIISRSYDLSRELPTDTDALSCALEFAEAYLPEFAGNRAEYSYSMPAWLMADISDWKGEPVEELIDGNWRLANPKWAGLPGDKSADLDLMASLREKPAQTVKDLTAQAKMTDSMIRARLARLEGWGFVVRSIDRPERWSLANPLPD